MNPFSAVITCFRKYFVFSGRARRSEFWWFLMVWIISDEVTIRVDNVIFPPSYPEIDDTMSFLEGFWLAFKSDLTPLSSMFYLVAIIPLLSVSTRRLHDIGRSGWWLPLLVVSMSTIVGGTMYAYARGTDDVLDIITFPGALVSILVFFVFLFLLSRDSERDDNRYGPSPKYGDEAAVFN